MTFDLANQWSDPVAIRSLSVSTSSADLLRETNVGSNEAGQHEMFVESPTASGRYEAGDGSGDNYPLGETSELTRDVSVEPGDAAAISLYAFQTSDGKKVNMKSRDVNVTVTFVLPDGTTTTETYTVTPS